VHAHPVSAGALGQLIADRLLDFLFEDRAEILSYNVGTAARDVDVDLSGGGVIRANLGGGRNRCDRERQHARHDYESRNPQDGCRLAISFGAGKRVSIARTLGVGNCGNCGLDTTRSQIAPRARNAAIAAAS
jgi:hypothetical protein